jgi:hypothetical protein
MNLWPIFLPSLAAGMVFALLAVRLSTTKGNRIADILRARHLSDGEAIKVIVGKLSITSTIPIVALFVVSCVVAVGPTTLFWWLQNKDGRFITLSARFDPPPSEPVYVAIGDRDPTSPFFFWKIPYVADDHELLVLESRAYDPVTIYLTANPFKGTVTAEIMNSVDQSESPVKQEIRISPDGHSVSMTTPIKLVLEQQPINASTLPTQPSKASPVRNSIFKGVAPPPGISGSAN